jgi:hypothetical protein
MSLVERFSVAANRKLRRGRSKVEKWWGSCTVYYVDSALPRLEWAQPRVQVHASAAYIP